MNRKFLSLLIVLLVMSTLFLAGCERPLSPDVEGIGEEDLMNQEAAENTTPVVEEPTLEVTEPIEAATPVVTEEVTPEPTVEPTEETTPEPTPEPTEDVTAEPTEEATAEPTEEATEAPITTGPQQYVVKAGDTLYSIASRYGLSVPTLARANNITNPAFIYVGQVLTIPGSGTAPSPQPQPGPGDDLIHYVQPGENLFRIALKYNYDYYYLARYNNIRNPSVIYVGQPIRIPR
ncbi:MAG: LysM peptidoglycan-binding domain-containing protein [Anaerolineales bacterium]